MPKTTVDPARQYIALPIGGMSSAGDASAIGQDNARLIRNFLHRPGGRIDARPPFTYDGLLNISGLVTWEDIPNQQTRFGALDTSNNLYLKNVGAETYGAPFTSASTQGGRLTGFTTLRGVLYACFDDGAGNPRTIASFDGTTLIAADITAPPAVWPLNALLASRQVVSFIDRLFFMGVRIAIANIASITDSYDWTGSHWPKTNITATKQFLSGITSAFQCMLYPTSTAAQSCQIIYSRSIGPLNVGLVPIAASNTPSTAMWRFDVLGTDPLNQVPFTLEMVLWSIKANTTAYNVGDMIGGQNGFAYVCSQAGTTGTNVALGTVVNVETTDNTVKWMCIGTDVMGTMESFVPTSVAAPDFTPFYVMATVPPQTNGVVLTPRLKLYNTTQPALSVLSPIIISRIDGFADGDPRKANHGQQWTLGDFYYEFFNQFNSTTRILNVEAIMWSETSQPKEVRAINTYQPQEEAGMPTMGCVSGGRLVMAKRRAIWSFVGNTSPDAADNPILPEGPAQLGTGVIGPQAWDISADDEIFFIGETEVYRYQVGNIPLPICGDEMREEIMDHLSGTWVEDQPTYNMPLLAIDPVNREVWVYTQRGVLYCYHDMLNRLPAATAMIYNPKAKGLWSKHDVAQDGTKDVSALMFNPVTGKMMVSFGGHGLTRLDQTIGNTLDTIDAGAGIMSSAQVILRPIELFAPRIDAIIEEIAPYLVIERVGGIYLPQSGQLTMGVSYNRGLTFPNYDTVTFDPSVPRVPFPVFQFGSSVTLSLTYTGPLGAQAIAISKIEAVAQMLGSELAQVLPSQVGSNL